jgi:hypothetical protein
MVLIGLRLQTEQGQALDDARDAQIIVCAVRPVFVKLQPSFFAVCAVMVTGNGQQADEIPLAVCGRTP